MTSSAKSVKFSTPEQVHGPSSHIVLPPKTPYPGKTRASNDNDTINHGRDKPTAPLTVHEETGQMQREQVSSSSSTVPSSKKRSSAVKASVVAEKLRMQTNGDSLNYIRTIKYQVATLHKHLLKVEDEIKLMNKGRRTLEYAVQDARKSLSVSQQSLSAQQKKARVGQECMIALFREETRILSKCKRDLESYLQSIRHQLHSLDGMRKTIKSKISSLSKSLQLDAQSFKLYNGPIDDTGPLSTKPRHYETKCSKPSSPSSDTSFIPQQLLTQLHDLLQASKEMRAGIKGLVMSVHTRQHDAHKKVNSMLTQSVKEAEKHKSQLTMEKGHARLQQNSIGQEIHNTEIAIGLVSGPISEVHKSVGERKDRPLSRLRPATANCDEPVGQHVKEARAKLKRQLSASQARMTSVAQTEHSLASKYQEESLSASFDSHVLRVRRMSLDNRWAS